MFIFNYYFEIYLPLNIMWFLHPSKNIGIVEPIFNKKSCGWIPGKSDEYSVW